MRQRCYLFTLDWVKRQATADDFVSCVADLEDLLQLFIISGLTDVWSATRKVCAQRFKSIGQLLPLEQQEGLFRRLLDAWKDAQDAWKAKEGILLGLAAVIAQFSNVDVKEGEAAGAEGPGEGDQGGLAGTENEAGVKVRLRFGSQDLEALPSFITEHLKPLLFGALAHPQLSVRENAARAFSSYLSRTPLHETQVCLAQVIRKLHSGAHAQGQAADAESGGLSCGSAGAEAQGAGDSRRRRPRLVEAFEAQGLLSLAIDLIERLPSRLILRQWDSLIDTFSLYLSHSASTVRQACSSLFLKFMAKRDEGAASLQRLVLQGLSAPSNLPAEGSSKANVDGGGGGGMRSRGDSNEWIVQSSPVAMSPGIAALAASHANPGADDDADGAEQTWEDREGRLLAYELVLGFLVEDHTLNMFKSDPRLLPTASPVSPKKLSPVDSADYVHHFHQGGDGNSSDRLEHQAYKRDRSPDGDTSWRNEQAAQSNLSPYNASWLQSPAVGIPASPASESGGEGLRKPRRTSPHRTSKSPTRGGARKPGDTSVLDTFRLSDSPHLPLDSVADANPAGYGEFAAALPVTFEPLGVVLHRMFDEVLLSIGHVRWELRRMGLQVLPLLCTTALWHDMSLLQQLWERWLLTDGSGRKGLVHDTLHSYVGILVLKEIVKKVVPSLSRPVLPVENCVAAASAPCANLAHPTSIACVYNVWRVRWQRERMDGA